MDLFCFQPAKNGGPFPSSVPTVVGSETAHRMGMAILQLRGPRSGGEQGGGLGLGLPTFCFSSLAFLGWVWGYWVVSTTRADGVKIRALGA